MGNFKVGEKVVPIQKTVAGFSKLEYCNQWEEAKDTQGFLYIAGFDSKHNAFLCNANENSTAGNFYYERDLKLYEDRPTKNQRITSLEEKVTALEKTIEEYFALPVEPSTIINTTIVNEVVKPSTDISVEDKQKSPNQLRAEIIEKAKVFVESELKRGLNSDERNELIGNETYKNHFYVVEFIAKDSKVTALVKRSNYLGEAQNKNPRHIGRANCMPGDVFNEHIGKAIALGRALGLEVSEFEGAVQPNEVVEGMVVRSERDWLQAANGPFCKGEIFKVGEEIGLNICQVGSGIAKNSTILNDTNAIYGGVE